MTRPTDRPSYRPLTAASSIYGALAEDADRVLAGKGEPRS
jgi:hypothetical protein